jgi:hypothetical protein
LLELSTQSLARLRAFYGRISLPLLVRRALLFHEEKLMLDGMPPGLQLFYLPF